MKEGRKEGGMMEGEEQLIEANEKKMMMESGRK